jgi:guanylate kinase
MKIKNKKPIVAISGVSAAGKGSVLQKLRQYPDRFVFSVSHTTRQPRVGEVHGQDYFFISEEDFEDKIKNNFFLEWMEVHEYNFGTSKNSFQSILDSGKIPVVEADVHGVENLKGLFENVHSFFIIPPSVEEAIARLEKRGTETKAQIAKRIERYERELAYQDKYDHIIVNDDLSRAQEQLLATVDEIEKSIA